MEELRKKFEELTKEELVTVTMDYYSKIEYLANTINSITASHKRLEFLFKVLENKDSFSSDFLVSVIEEIEDGLTIKEGE